jgi:hypothetical protein
MIELEWVPVAARLPDDEDLVLVARDDGEVGAGFVAADVWFWSDAMPVGDGRVTHWMRMPPTPGKCRMLRLGEICSLLGHDVTEAFLAKLGFFPAKHDRAARLYFETDYPKIRIALARHALVMAGTPPRWHQSEEGDAGPGPHSVRAA